VEEVNACITQDAMLYGMPRAKAFAAQWASEAWKESEEEYDVVAPKVAASGKTYGAQLLSALKEYDYSSLVTAALSAK